MRGATALLLLAACGGSPPRFRGSELPPACRGEPTEELVVEQCVGWFFDQLLMTEVWKPYADRDLAVYVGAVGLRVAAAAGDDLAIEFRVLDEEEPQAWSLPGGYVYVTRGALASLSTEAELAALLAHEIGHIAAGHGDDLFTPGGSATADSKTLLGALEHERDEERQADELAVGYLAGAGYEPRAVASMLVALETAAARLVAARAAAAGRAGPAADDEPDDEPDEHPALLARVARALRVAHGRGGGERAEQRYRTRTAGLHPAGD